MIPLLDGAQMCALDRYAIEELGLPGVVLMETAGRAVSAAVIERFGDKCGELAIVCGTGNNGGDGFVAGRWLLGAGCRPTVYLLGSTSQVKGDAKVHLNAFVSFGGRLVECAPKGPKPSLGFARVLIDAIFGTGLDREVGGLAAKWIMEINRSKAWVLAVDIPSGVSATDGRIMGVAVRADATVTFGHLKQGHFFYPGSTLSGEVKLVDIGLPEMAPAIGAPDLLLAAEGDFRGTFVRGDDSHKGHFGHVGVVAGGRGKMGASALAALATLKTGSGLCTALFPAGLALEVRFSPEVMTAPLGAGFPGPLAWTPALFEGAAAALSGLDAAVVGPGMGTDREAEDFLELILGAEGRPHFVLDADALTLLAKRPDLRSRVKSEDILTPHPGEAGRLLGRTGEEVQADRLASARELADRFGAVVVLKGHNTLIAANGSATLLIPRGNPGMATAGSGDVLAGVAGAFVARGLPAFQAAAAAVWVHGSAGDLAASSHGVEGLTAGDIIASLPRAMGDLSRPS